MLSNRSFWVLLVLLLWVTAALGQTSRGTISGTIVDPTGAIVTGAAVKFEQVGTGLTGSTVTTNAGLFSFTDLPPGTYTITVTQTGFATQRIQQVRVEVGKTTSLPVNLSIAREVQTVEITAAAATLETNQSALNAVVVP
jgi:hypothetical protein